MVSHQLQENEDFYAGFVDGFDTMKEFCTQVSNSKIRNVSGMNLERSENGQLFYL